MNESIALIRIVPRCPKQLFIGSVSQQLSTAQQSWFIVRYSNSNQHDIVGEKAETHSDVGRRYYQTKQPLVLHAVLRVYAELQLISTPVPHTVSYYELTWGAKKAERRCWQFHPSVWQVVRLTRLPRKERQHIHLVLQQQRITLSPARRVPLVASICA